MIHRIKIGEATQPPGTHIRNFHATLKGMAKLCQYRINCPSCDANVDFSHEVIQDQLVRGLNDREILTDLMGDAKTDRTLDEVVEFIARKEQGKLEREKVGCGVPRTGAMGAGTPTKSPNCWACQGASHGTPNNVKARQEHCPAWNSTCTKCNTKGHEAKVCTKCINCEEWGHRNKGFRKCPQNKSTKNGKAVESGAMYSTLCSTFIGSQLEGVFSLADMTLATLGNGKKRAIPLTHHIFDKEMGWLSKPSEPHSTIRVESKICEKDHDSFGFPIQDTTNLRKSIDEVVADSGCQSTAVPPSFVYKLGIKRKDFIPVASKMNGAGRSDLGVIGGVVIQKKVFQDWTGST